MINNKILSICIPTFDRASKLKSCLENIFKQLVVDNILDNIEVVISDNNSSDETYLVVKEFMDKYDNISYFKNNLNLGFDRNVDIVITKAVGNFAWIIADDEYTRDNSINLVLNILQSNSDVAFIAMCDEYQKIKGDYECFSNGSDCLKSIGIFSGGVSRCIYNRSFLPADRDKYYDNHWIHLSIAMEMVANRKMIIMKNIFIPQPIVAPRLAVNGAPFYYSLYIRKIFKDLKKIGYNKSVINTIVTRLTRVMLRNLASAKLCGLHTGWSEYKLLVVNFYDAPFYLIILTFIFFCPTSILFFARAVHNKIAYE